MQPHTREKLAGYLRSLRYIFESLIRVLIAYLFLFFLHRLLFVLFHFRICRKEGMGQLLRTFYEALPLDLSAACYLGAFSFILFCAQLLWDKNALLKFHRVVWGLFVFLTTLVAVSDILVYKEMNVKIHFKLLYHLKHPAEVYQSVSTGAFFAGVLVIGLFTFFYCKLMFRFCRIRPVPEGAPGMRVAVLLFLLPLISGLLLTGIRGGWKEIPINESRVYFTQYHVLDDAAVNPSWTLLHSYIENRKAGNSNPYVFMPAKSADSLVKEMYATADSTFEEILTTSRPNLVYIILESWTADVVAGCGGMPGVSPRFDSLSREGILFSNAYASGQLSHHGIPAILSSYPSQPITAIIQNSNKYPHLSCISRTLASYQYNSSFYFGGQLIYGNMKGYLYYNQFDVLREMSDYSAPRHLKNKLGIHDEFMFQKWLEDLNTKKEPFFSCLFTVSTHSPYKKVEQEKPWLRGPQSPYLNSVYYSDSCLGDFFRKAKGQSWFQNTLFVIVADHSHYSPRGHANSSPEHNHIPLLLYGNVLKKEYRGKVISQVASQTDITATVLGQMKIPHSQYTWSKSLFDTLHPFAFYSFYNGYGLVTPKGNLVWDKKAGKYITNTFRTADSVTYRQMGEAYLQKLFQQYLDF